MNHKALSETAGAFAGAFADILSVHKGTVWQVSFSFTYEADGGGEGYRTSYIPAETEQEALTKALSKIEHDPKEITVTSSIIVLKYRDPLPSS